MIPVENGTIQLERQEKISHLAMAIGARAWGCVPAPGASFFRKLTVEENIRAVLELQEPSRGRHRDAPVRIAPSPQHPRTSAVDPALPFGRRATTRGDRTRARHASSFILLDEPLPRVDPIAVSTSRKSSVF